MGHRANFGFKPDADRDGYEIDEVTMPVVRRIFELINETGSVNGTMNILNREGVPSPAGKRWPHTTIRKIILSDLYRPHSYEGVVEMVDPAVVRLDPNKTYGLWYYNRRQVKHTQDPDAYKRRTKTIYKDPDQWIAVPVTDAGINRTLVDRARKLVENNVKNSNAGRRDCWELSGGILKCGSRGRVMVARTVSRRERDDFYYTCRTYRTRPRICDYGTHYKAENLEGRVAYMVSDLVVNRDRLMAHMREKIEALRQDLGRDYPEAEAARIADQLNKIDRAKKIYRRQAAEELISFGELKEALAEVEAERMDLTTRLEKLRNREKYIKKLESNQGVMLAVFTGSLACGLPLVPPRARQDIYRRLDLTATVEPGGHIELSGKFDVNCLPSPEQLEIKNKKLQYRNNTSV